MSASCSVFGHFIGMLTPHAVPTSSSAPGTKQLLAMVSGGIAAWRLLGGGTAAAAPPHRAAHSRQLRPATSSCCGCSWSSWCSASPRCYLGRHLDGSVMMLLPTGASTSLLSAVARRPDCRHKLGVQAAPVPRHDHLPDRSHSPVGPYLGGFARSAILSVLQVVRSRRLEMYHRT